MVSHRVFLTSNKVWTAHLWKKPVSAVAYSCLWPRWTLRTNNPLQGLSTTHTQPFNHESCVVQEKLEQLEHVENACSMIAIGNGTSTDTYKQPWKQRQIKKKRNFVSPCWVISLYRSLGLLQKRSKTSKNSICIQFPSLQQQRDLACTKYTTYDALVAGTR